MRGIVRWAASVGAALVFATTVMAQEAEPAAEPEAAPKRERPKLEEIIVTAQKREENVQDVPISMSAIGQDAIKDSNMETMNDVKLFTPNLFIAATPTLSFIYMRGLGSGNNDGFEQAVGLYVDGVYYGRSAYINDAFLDFSRIEVLRGPQGTLFGKNTIAGALSIWTGRPHFDWEFGGDVLIGEFNQRRVNAVVNAPIIEDMLAVRVAASYNERVGHTKNIFRGIDELNIDKINFRGKALFTPSANFDMVVSVEWSQLQDNGPAFQFIDLQQDARTVHSLFCDGCVEDDDPRTNQTDTESRDERWTKTANLTMNWTIGEYDLTGIIGYSGFNEDTFFDADMGPAPLVHWFNDDAYDQASAEFRVASPLGEFEYVAGIYGFWNKFDTKSEVRIFTTDEPGTRLANISLPIPGVGSLLDVVRPTLLDLLEPAFVATDPLLVTLVADALDQTFVQETYTLAAFGQATWNVSDRFALVLGMRAGWERKDVLLIQDFRSTGILLEQALGLTEYELDDSRTEVNFAPKVSAKYYWTPDIMTYATIARGFKAGGYNPFAPTFDQATFEQETATTFEGGAKMTLWDGRATLNVGLYHSRFRDLQVSVVTGAGNQFIVDNAAEARTQGIEIDATVLAFENFLVIGTFGFIDARYISFENGPCVSESEASACDLSGKSLDSAPRVNGSLSANYFRPLFNWGFGFFVGADAIYTGDTFLVADRDEQGFRDGFWQFNARGGFRDVDERWTFVVQAKNVTDEEVLAAASDVTLFSGSFFGVYDLPRLISAELRVSF